MLIRGFGGHLGQHKEVGVRQSSSPSDPPDT